MSANWRRWLPVQLSARPTTWSLRIVPTPTINELVKLNTLISFISIHQNFNLWPSISYTNIKVNRFLALLYNMYSFLPVVVYRVLPPYTFRFREGKVSTSPLTSWSPDRWNGWETMRNIHYKQFIIQLTMPRGFARVHFVVVWCYKPSRWRIFQMKTNSSVREFNQTNFINLI